VKVEVGKGAVFYSLPDPVVCFAGARFSQRQDIQLEEDASLILLDSLHSGREHSGERWVFDRYQNEIHVSRGGKKIFFESQLLDPVIGDLKKRQSRFNAYSLLLIIGKAFVNEVAGILNVIQSRPLEANEDFVCAASPVGTDGVIVRMVSVSTESMAVATRELLYFLPKKLGDDPWARKW
jgi:urease accessory protein